MMSRGHVSNGSEPVRGYDEPVVVSLEYNEMEKDPFLTPKEAQVWFELGGSLKDAFVPLYIVDEEVSLVTATLLGERDEKVLVSFPPTTFGQTSFTVDKADLEKIIRKG